MGFKDTIKKMDSKKTLKCPKCHSKLEQKNMPGLTYWECTNPKCPYWGGIPANDVKKLMEQKDDDETDS